MNEKINELTDKIKKIINEELAEYKDKPVWMAVELIGKGTGVKGDIGLYGYIVVLKLISEDETDIALSWPVLRKIRTLISSIPEISRVLYDLK